MGAKGEPPGAVPQWGGRLGTEIHRLFAGGKASTMELSNVVYSASRLCTTASGPICVSQGNFRFQKRKGEMLAYIGQRMGSTDSQTLRILPYGWSILYCLARLDQKCARISCEPARFIRLLLCSKRGNWWHGLQVVAILPHVVCVRERLHRFQTFVRTTVHDWSGKDRLWVVSQLRRLVAELGGPAIPKSCGRIDASESPSLISIDTKIQLLTL